MAPPQGFYMTMTLSAGLADLGLALSDAQQAQLLSYMALIERWNKVYNLTALRQQDTMLTHHLLDCLALLPPLRAHVAQTGLVPHILDVGSGAGLPGLVIAICQPDWRVDCVDTVAKKAAFMQQTAANLGLKNAKIHHARVEELAQKQDARYSIICSRAFSSLADFVQLTESSLHEQGVWLAMKGRTPEAQELEALKDWAVAERVEPIVVPGLDAQRCLVWLKPAQKTV